MNDDEAQFSVEFPVDTQAFMWSDKYRPRKPRFFNRVHTVSTFLPFLNHIALFTLLHAERQKLYTIFAFLSVIGLTDFTWNYSSYDSCYLKCTFLAMYGGGRVVRWCWINFQCRGILQFGLQ